MQPLVLTGSGKRDPRSSVWWSVVIGWSWALRCRFGVVSVLPVVEQRDPGSWLGDIDPAVGADLETRSIPAGVGVDRRAQVPELDLTRHLRGVQVERERHLQQLLLFVQSISLCTSSRGDPARSSMVWVTVELRNRRSVRTRATIGPRSSTSTSTGACSAAPSNTVILRRLNTSMSHAS